MFQGIPFAPISDVRELPRAHSMGRPPPHTHTQRAVWLARCLTKGWPQHCAFSLVTSIAGCLQQWFEDIESEGVLAELPRGHGEGNAAFLSFISESVFITQGSVRSPAQGLFHQTPCPPPVGAGLSVPSASPLPGEASALSSDKWSSLLFEILFATVKWVCWTRNSENWWCFATGR